MTLNRSFRELLESFHARRVRFLIVGGYAVIFHGHPRMTQDLDLWIDLEPDNLDRLASCLEECGYGIADFFRRQLQVPDRVVSLGAAPQRIDLLTGVGPFDFGEVHARRVLEVWDGVELPTVSLRDLRALKKASGRLQDLADLEALPEED